MDDHKLAQWLRVSASSPSSTPYVVTTLLLTIGLFFIVKTFTSSSRSCKILPSPRTTLLPHLSKAQLATLPYPADALPGGRDLSTPYGTMRIYEFGPSSGRRVLMIHGITTPCLALGDVARGLAKAGCRVTLFDLWGRGYSDCPADLPHDIRLYTSQILFALTSSQPPPSTQQYNVIGYSLGGAIAASFAAHCPQLVHSLTLLAPGGLIRPHHIGRASRFMYSSGIIPERLVQYLVLRRLKEGRQNIPPPPAAAAVDTSAAVASEISAKSNGRDPRDQDHHHGGAPGRVDAPSVVAWQVDHHQGFLCAFISSIRYAPISGYHADWRAVGERLRGERGHGSWGKMPDAGESEREPMVGNKVLIILGETDKVIVRDETVEDATKALGGKENVEIHVLEGAGHDFPMTRSEECVELISSFWRMDEGGRSTTDAGTLVTGSIREL